MQKIDDVNVEKRIVWTEKMVALEKQGETSRLPAIDQRQELEPGCITFFGDGNGDPNARQVITLWPETGRVAYAQNGDSQWGVCKDADPKRGFFWPDSFHIVLNDGENVITVFH